MLPRLRGWQRFLFGKWDVRMRWMWRCRREGGKGREAKGIREGESFAGGKG